MNHEVRTYKFTCDSCRKVEFVRDVTYCTRPEGWGIVDEYDCGSTGYNRSDDLCTECYKGFLHKRAIKNANMNINV